MGKPGARVLNHRPVLEAPGPAADSDLVSAFHHGDPSAYSEIYRRHRPLVDRVCRRLLGNDDDAEEAAQETMVRVLQGLPRFDGNYLKAWVARIATNVCLDAIRARARQPQNGHQVIDISDVQVTGDGNGHDGDPGQVVMEAAERDEVHAVLEVLPEHHRVALVLREFEGLSHEEIASAMSMSPSQVKALIHRARRSFRRAWGDGVRRGLAVLLPPFLAPLHSLRRLLHRAQEVEVHAAASASASPSVQLAVAAAGERISVAMATVLVAGAAGLGLTLPGGESTAPSPKPAKIAAPAPASTQAPLPPGKRPERFAEAKEAKAVDESAAEVLPSPEALQEVAQVQDPEPGSQPNPGTGPEPGPGPGPGPAPSVDPPPDPSPAPPPEPSPSPSPPSGPAPPWSFGFHTSVHSTSLCGCVTNPWRPASTTSGQVGGQVTFREVVVGAARDAEGDPAWRLWVEYSGQATDDTGNVTVRFRLHSPEGQYDYSASGHLASMVPIQDGGGHRYTFSGSYGLEQGPTTWEAVPRQGAFTLALDWWADGTSLYRVGFSLQEG